MDYFQEMSPENFLVYDTDSLEEILIKIERNTYGIVFVLNADSILMGSVSDGDIRRGIIKYGLSELEVKSICNHGVKFAMRTHDSAYDLPASSMDNNPKVLPIINARKHVVSMLVPKRHHLEKHDADFVIMAGGRGARLLPLTADTPKPMLPINGKPMIEHIIIKAANEGFKNIIISVNYKKESIIEYFGDGLKWGVRIQYIIEDKPLGTAGALSLIESGAPHFVVTNCDVITDLSYSNLLRFSKTQNAIATMAVYNFTTDIDFGVVDVDGFHIKGFREKPKFTHFINSGVYCLMRDALKYIEQDTFVDMPSLFEVLAREGKKTYAMPMFESWIDVGRPEDLEKVNL